MNDFLYPIKVILRYSESIDPNDENVVIKPWGFEKLIVNTELYSLKLLQCRNHIWSSGGLFHFHENKDETFYILEGTLGLQLLSNDGHYSNHRPSEGKTFRVRPRTKHRFQSWSIITTFMEVATHCDNNDSFKIIPIREEDNE